MALLHKTRERHNVHCTGSPDHKRAHPKNGKNFRLGLVAKKRQANKPSETHDHKRAHARGQVKISLPTQRIWIASLDGLPDDANTTKR